MMGRIRFFRIFQHFFALRPLGRECPSGTPGDSQVTCHSIRCMRWLSWINMVVIHLVRPTTTTTQGVVSALSVAFYEILRGVRHEEQVPGDDRDAELTSRPSVWMEVLCDFACLATCTISSWRRSLVPGVFRVFARYFIGMLFLDKVVVAPVGVQRQVPWS